MQNWIETFLEVIYTERAASENTLKGYATDLQEFSAFLATRKTTFETAERDDVEAYLISLEDRGLAEATRARRLSAAKQLFRFSFEEGWRSDDPSIQIKGPKKKRHLPKTLTEEEVDMLDNAAALCNL